MAPNPGSEAEYIREKARRDLLNLLESVSKADIYIPSYLTCMLIVYTGSRQKEPCD